MINNQHIHIDGDKHHHLQQSYTRMMFILGLFIIGFIIMGGRLTSLSLFKTKTSSGIYSSSTNNGSTPNYSPRADITDRNGVVLATTLKMPILYVDPSIISSPTNIAKDLARILNINEQMILKKLYRKGHFVPLYNALTPKQQKAINDLGYPSLGFKDGFRRVYPEKNLLSHIIGYTDSDNLGIAGIEKQYEKRLLQSEPLKLTIDSRVQYILKTQLQKTITHFEAIGGSGIIMDVETGEILAMVSLPDFDVHHPNKASDKQLFNRNTTGVFEMGSTFKLFSIAAALEYGTVKLSDKFDVSEPFKFGKYKIKDFHREKKPLTLAEVFTHSSNIGTAQVAERLGTEKLREFYKSLGLFDRLKIDLPERARPLLPKKWRDINTITASYGHGMAVTPLHLVRATAAIVNDGILPTPKLVKQPQLKNSVELRVVSPKTSAIMRNFLENVVTQEKGTGKKGFAKGYNVGGKTGTSEKVSGKKYDKKSLFSSFLGVFPIQNPKYVVFVNIDEPKGQKDTYNFATGGWTAAPVVGKVIAKMAPLLGMLPEPSNPR